MREKLLAELKKKFSGLSNELLGLLADKLVSKVTAEDQIQGAITELDNSPIPVADFAAFLQKEGDRRATAATQTHEKTLREKYEFKDKAAPAGDPPPGGDSATAAQLKALSDKIEAFESKEKKQALRADFLKALDEKKIPASFARGRDIETAEQIEAMVLDAEKEYGEIKQGLVNEGLSQQPKPLGSTEKPDTIAADIAAWVGPKK